MNASKTPTRSKSKTPNFTVTNCKTADESKILPFPVKAIKNASNGDEAGKKRRKPAKKLSKKEQKERDELLSKDSTDPNVLSAQIGAFDPNLTAIFGSKGFSKFMERMCWRILGVKDPEATPPKPPKGRKSSRK
jgi:hypothetical protein